jgi:hypothetical protein
LSVLGLQCITLGARALQTRTVVDLTYINKHIDVMATEFAHVTVPDTLRRLVGDPDEGTRCYYTRGSEEEAGAWFDAIAELFNCVSPGGVSMFAPVTRAGIHKRLKEGRLTAFYFQVTEVRRTIFGQKRKGRQTAYGLIPVVECKAWGKELQGREERLTKKQEEMYAKWKKKKMLAASPKSTPLPREKEDAEPALLDEPDTANQEAARQEYLKKQGATKWEAW